MFATSTCFGRDVTDVNTAPREEYHHGDLRRALIAATVALIEEQGPEAFTLREVARRVGVSHTAPYRHFATWSTVHGFAQLVIDRAFERRLAEVRPLEEWADAVTRLGLSGLEA
jgi:AcrR family transcriptional regulator